MFVSSNSFTHFWKEGSGLFCMSSLPPPPPNPLELDELALPTAASMAPLLSTPLLAVAAGPRLLLLLWVCVIISSAPILYYVGSRSRFFGSCPFFSPSSGPHFARESCNWKRGQESSGEMCRCTSKRGENMPKLYKYPTSSFTSFRL